jgi:pantoate--beta-alanine ligase
MRTITSIDEMRRFSGVSRERAETLGLVPTMGALHEGHVALVKRAQSRCGVVVTSIFVNPTQFGPGEDFQQYPRNLARDLHALEGLGVDAVFTPDAAEMYPTAFATQVDPGKIATIVEGALRPGHFRGVATVVLKLFQIVQPDLACFGQKDFQQAVIIRRMIEDLNVNVRLEIVPIVREPDGLARSSRNVYLSEHERRAAAALSAALRQTQAQWWAGERSPASLVARMDQALAAEPLLQPDYVTVREPRNLDAPATAEPGSVALVSARLGATRLIDNAILGPRDLSEDELVRLAFG